MAMKKKKKEESFLSVFVETLRRSLPEKKTLCLLVHDMPTSLAPSSSPSPSRNMKASTSPPLLLALSFFFFLSFSIVLHRFFFSPPSPLLLRSPGMLIFFTLLLCTALPCSRTDGERPLLFFSLLFSLCFSSSSLFLGRVSWRRRRVFLRGYLPSKCAGEKKKKKKSADSPLPHLREEKECLSLSQARGQQSSPTEEKKTKETFRERRRRSFPLRATDCPWLLSSGPSKDVSRRRKILSFPSPFSYLSSFSSPPPFLLLLFLFLCFFFPVEQKSSHVVSRAASFQTERVEASFGSLRPALFVSQAASADLPSSSSLSSSASSSLSVDFDVLLSSSSSSFHPHAHQGGRRLSSSSSAQGTDEKEEGKEPFGGSARRGEGKASFPGEEKNIAKDVSRRQGHVSALAEEQEEKEEREETRSGHAEERSGHVSPAASSRGNQRPHGGGGGEDSREEESRGVSSSLSTSPSLPSSLSPPLLLPPLVPSSSSSSYSPAPLSPFSSQLYWRRQLRDRPAPPPPPPPSSSSPPPEPSLPGSGVGRVVPSPSSSPSPPPSGSSPAVNSSSSPRWSGAWDGMPLNLEESVEDFWDMTDADDLMSGRSRRRKNSSTSEEAGPAERPSLGGAAMEEEEEEEEEEEDAGSGGVALRPRHPSVSRVSVQENPHRGEEEEEEEASSEEVGDEEERRRPVQGEGEDVSSDGLGFVSGGGRAARGGGRDEEERKRTGGEATEEDEEARDVVGEKKKKNQTEAGKSSRGDGNKNPDAYVVASESREEEEEDEDDDEGGGGGDGGQEEIKKRQEGRGGAEGATRGKASLEEASDKRRRRKKDKSSQEGRGGNGASSGGNGQAEEEEDGEEEEEEGEEEEEQEVLSDFLRGSGTSQVAEKLSKSEGRLSSKETLKRGRREAAGEVRGRKGGGGGGRRGGDEGSREEEDEEEEEEEDKVVGGSLSETRSKDLKKKVSDVHTPAGASLSPPTPAGSSPEASVRRTGGSNEERKERVSLSSLPPRGSSDDAVDGGDSVLHSPVGSRRLPKGTGGGSVTSAGRAGGRGTDSGLLQRRRDSRYGEGESAGGASGTSSPSTSPSPFSSTDSVQDLFPGAFYSPPLTLPSGRSPPTHRYYDYFDLPPSTPPPFGVHTAATSSGVPAAAGGGANNGGGGSSFFPFYGSSFALGEEPVIPRSRMSPGGREDGGIVRSGGGSSISQGYGVSNGEDARGGGGGGGGGWGERGGGLALAKINKDEGRVAGGGGGGGGGEEEWSHGGLPFHPHTSGGPAGGAGGTGAGGEGEDYPGLCGGDDSYYPCDAGAQILSFQSLMKRLYRSYCTRLGRDPRWQRQFGILVLSAVDWPLYTHKRYWKHPDVQQFFETITLITDDKDDDQLTGPNVRYVKQIRACSFDSILRNQLKELQMKVRNADDFFTFVKAQKAVDTRLQDLLSYLPENRLAIVLSRATLGNLYQAVSQLQILYYYSDGFTKEEATRVWQWKFRSERRMHWSILQLMEVWDQFITSKQMNGVIILQVDKVTSREEAVLRLFDFVENEQTQKALLQFESTVTTAITMRIRKVAKHFRNLLAFGWLSARKEESFRLPDCVVTAFYLKPGGDRKSERTSGGRGFSSFSSSSSSPPSSPGFSPSRLSFSEDDEGTAGDDLHQRYGAPRKLSVLSSFRSTEEQDDQRETDAVDTATTRLEGMAEERPERPGNAGAHGGQSGGGGGASRPEVGRGGRILAAEEEGAVVLDDDSGRGGAPVAFSPVEPSPGGGGPAFGGDYSWTGVVGGGGGRSAPKRQKRETSQRGRGSRGGGGGAAGGGRRELAERPKNASEAGGVQGGRTATSKKAGRQQGGRDGPEEGSVEGDSSGGSVSTTRTTPPIETGQFGFEIQPQIARVLKDRLPAGSMYIQLSLMDPWDSSGSEDMSVRELLHPSSDTVISAYRATQILKANLEWDPTLVGVGIAKVVYTTITDRYSTSTDQTKGGKDDSEEYDNDRNLIIRVSTELFKGEENLLDDVLSMVVVPSLQNSAPRTVADGRVKVMGTARRLAVGDILKTGTFCLGIPYSQHRVIDNMADGESILAHIQVTGLHEKSRDNTLELPATAIYDRFVRRSRGKYKLLFVDVVPKQKASSAQSRVAQPRSRGYPAWVLLLSNLCVAIFFLFVIVCLLVNRHVRLPWWIACICGSENPFQREPTGTPCYMGEQLGEHMRTGTDGSGGRGGGGGGEGAAGLHFCRGRSMSFSLGFDRQNSLVDSRTSSPKKNSIKRISLARQYYDDDICHHPTRGSLYYGDSILGGGGRRGSRFSSKRQIFRHLSNSTKSLVDFPPFSTHPNHRLKDDNGGGGEGGGGHASDSNTNPSHYHHHPSMILAARRSSSSFQKRSTASSSPTLSTAPYSFQDSSLMTPPTEASSSPYFHDSSTNNASSSLRRSSPSPLSPPPPLYEVHVTSSAPEDSADQAKRQRENNRGRAGGGGGGGFSERERAEGDGKRGDLSFSDGGRGGREDQDEKRELVEQKGLHNSGGGAGRGVVYPEDVGRNRRPHFFGGEDARPHGDGDAADDASSSASFPTGRERGVGVLAEGGGGGEEEAYPSVQSSGYPSCAKYTVNPVVMCSPMSSGEGSFGRRRPGSPVSTNSVSDVGSASSSSTTSTPTFATGEGGGGGGGEGGYSNSTSRRHHPSLTGVEHLRSLELARACRESRESEYLRRTAAGRSPPSPLGGR